MERIFIKSTDNNRFHRIRLLSAIFKKCATKGFVNHRFSIKSELNGYRVVLHAYCTVLLHVSHHLT
jgi:hypothetical protein